MSLNNNQKHYLRSLAHSQRALIQVGKHGITEALINEFNLVLDQHELVKVKLTADDRDSRKQQILELAEKTRAELVQSVGKMACYYRRNAEEPKLALPK